MDRPQGEPLLTPDQILLGPRLEPLIHIQNYDDKQFEAFIREWAYMYLQEVLGEYEQVGHFSGAGDLGRDIVAYLPRKDGQQQREFDIYQCKQYDHGLYPSDLWVELVKLGFYTWKKEFAVPRRYYFISSHNMGPKAGKLLEHPETLRAELKKEWAEESKKVVKDTGIPLEGDLLKHINDFDFSRVGHKQIEDVIEEFRKTRGFAPRFGGGLTKPLPDDPIPPAEIAKIEEIYTGEIFLAYWEHLKCEPLTLGELQASHRLLHDHFCRCRERFYSAEILRQYAKDNLPENVGFNKVQDQVHDQIIDIVMSDDHDDAYARLKAATLEAGKMTIVNHPLGRFVKAKSLHGICHQLVNNKRFRWILDE